MGLKDSIVRALAIRFARGKIKDLRGKDKDTTMGKILKAVDGWKLVIAVLALAGVQAWDMAHNGHAGDYVGIVLTLFGWTPGAEWSEIAKGLATHGLAVVAILHKLYKAHRQINAGSSVAGALTNEGHVAAFVEQATDDKSQAADAAKDVRDLEAAKRG